MCLWLWLLAQLYGGYGLSGVVGDVWVLDVSGRHHKWVQLEVIHGEAPPRSNHVAVPVEGK